MKTFAEKLKAGLYVLMTKLSLRCLDKFFLYHIPNIFNQLFDIFPSPHGNFYNLWNWTEVL